MLRSEVELALKRAKKAIPVEDAAREWFKDPEFVSEYEALEEEFAIVEALIKANSSTQ
jgi:hypothetical protein